MDRSDAATWRSLGVVAEAMGHDVEARDAFRRYLRLAPAAPDTGQVRAHLARL